MFKFVISLSVLSALVAVASCEDYTILTFAQTWPQSTCWAVNERYEMYYPCTICQLPQRGNNWTIHGLWPTNRYGIHPEFCEGGDATGDNGFNMQLQADLSIKWPGYKFNVEIFEFWFYQYSKHGTCAADNEDLNTLNKYFTKSISFLDRLNMGQILQNHGIVPGRQYRFNQFSRAIQASVGTGAYLVCIMDPQTNEQYLRQINICFEKHTFEPTHCSYDLTYRMRTNCRRNDMITYVSQLPPCVFE